jgi:hypothetical protein
MLFLSIVARKGKEGVIIIIIMIITIKVEDERE